jgi:hypothetical protein
MARGAGQRKRKRKRIGEDFKGEKVPPPEGCRTRFQAYKRDKHGKTERF